MWGNPDAPNWTVGLLCPDCASIDPDQITEHYQEVYRLHRINKCGVYEECVFCEVDKEEEGNK